MGSDFLKGKNILVTGGTGSIGGSLVRDILNQNPASVRVLSRDEYKQYKLAQSLGHNPRIRFLLGDIRDKERLTLAMESADYVFNAAALKQVPSCEDNPFEAVKTNVIGTQNVIEVAMKLNVEKVVLISTDKVVNPVNTMGTTKLLAEKLMRTAHRYKGSRRTVFSCVRFGNVLGTRGSVLPLFFEQLKQGNPLTLTHPDMTRFLMTMQRAVSLVLKGAELASRGEIFIMKMPSVRMGDLVSVINTEFARVRGLLSVPIDVVGVREGEKMHEELLFENERSMCHEMEDMLVVGFQQRPKQVPENVYKSDCVPLMNRAQILEMLLNDELGKSL